MTRIGFAAALSVALLGAASAPATVYNLGSFTVPPTQVVSITPATIGATGNFQDEFRFSVTAAITLTAGGMNTTALSRSGTIFSNLDFGAVELRSGFGNSGALIDTFTNGGDVNGFETSNIGTRSLAAGDYTIVINGNVLNAPARYDGNITFAAVPEPAVWAMMLGGFGVLGVATRRSRRTRRAIA